MAPTLKEVAQLAGVSTATVARVVHNRGRVSAITRQKVEKALESTNYQINIVAQGLRKQQNTTFGLILSCFTPNPFFAGVATGIEHEASKHGYSVIMCNVEGDPEKEQRAVRTLIQRRVSAIFFVVAKDPTNVEMTLSAGITAIQVERITKAASHAVTVDNWLGASLAVEHLIQQGHRNIAYIGGNPSNDFSLSRTWRSVEEQRFAGYTDTLEKHGLPIREELIVQGKYYTSDLDVHGPSGEGYRLTKKVLKHQPSAIFANCDILATGMLQAIYEAGLRVPEDISVIGYDDTYAPYLAPPLTTVAHPMSEVGQAAVRIAMNQLGQTMHQSRARLSEEIKPKLVVRKSTRCIRS